MANCRTYRGPIKGKVPKKKYDSKIDAKKAILSLYETSKDNRAVQAYKCPTCNFWHIGRPSARKHRINIDRKRREKHDEVLVGKLIGIIRGTYPGIPRKRKKSVKEELERIFAQYNDGDGIDMPMSTGDAISKIEALLVEKIDQAIVEYRDRTSTDGRPLNAKPLIIKQPVPCTGCGAEEYADWTLWPHQLYNKYQPGGVGHYCFPCFAEIVQKREKNDV